LLAILRTAVGFVAGLGLLFTGAGAGVAVGRSWSLLFLIAAAAGNEGSAILKLLTLDNRLGTDPVRFKSLPDARGLLEGSVRSGQFKNNGII